MNKLYQRRLKRETKIRIKIWGHGKRRENHMKEEMKEKYEEIMINKGRFNENKK